MNVKPSISHQYVSRILSNLVLAIILLFPLPSHAESGAVAYGADRSEATQEAFEDAVSGGDDE